VNTEFDIGRSHTGHCTLELLRNEGANSLSERENMWLGCEPLQPPLVPMNAVIDNDFSILGRF
jgi:hypothetical protein